MKLLVLVLHYCVSVSVTIEGSQVSAGAVCLPDDGM